MSEKVILKTEKINSNGQIQEPAGGQCQTGFCCIANKSRASTTNLYFFDQFLKSQPMRKFISIFEIKILPNLAMDQDVYIQVVQSHNMAKSSYWTTAPTSGR